MKTTRRENEAATSGVSCVTATKTTTRASTCTIEREDTQKNNQKIIDVKCSGSVGTVLYKMKIWSALTCPKWQMARKRRQSGESTPVGH